MSMNRRRSEFQFHNYDPLGWVASYEPTQPFEGFVAHGSDLDQLVLHNSAAKDGQQHVAAVPKFMRVFVRPVLYHFDHSTHY